MAGLINTPIWIFVVVVDPLYYDEIMAQRMAFAGTLGHLLQHAFTGEHVGEPRLLICLFARNFCMSISNLSPGHAHSAR